MSFYKKTIACVVFSSIILLTFTGCAPILGFSYISYDFMDNTDNIEKIELVKVIEVFSNEENAIIIDYKTNTLATISNIDEFLENFSYLSCFTFKILPPVIAPMDEYGIKLSYSSDSFEIIGAIGQTYFKKGEYKTTNKKQYFDEDEFDSFIEAYISSINNSSI